MSSRSLTRCLLPLLLQLASCAVYRPAPLLDPALGPRSVAEIVVAPRAHPRLASAPVDIAAPLSEWDLARITLAISPELIALRAQVDVSEAQLFASGLLPDPQLSVGVGHPAGADLVNVLSGALALELSSLLTQAPTEDAARANVEAAHHDLGWREWLAINQVRTLVRRIDALQRQLSFANDAAELTRQRLATDRNNLQLGDARIDDVSLSQIAFLDAQERALALARAVRSAQLQLNALIGLSPQIELALAATEPRADFRPPDSPAALSARALASRLDLMALRDGYQAQEAQLHRATRAALPLPQLELNRDRDSGAIWTTGGAATLTLPLWNRGRGDIAVAQASRTQLQAEYLARVHQMDADIAALCADLDALTGQRDALAAELPNLREADARLAAAAHDGDISRLNSEAVRAALLDQELALLGIDQARSEAQAALETAVGDFIWEGPQ